MSSDVSVGKAMSFWLILIGALLEVLVRLMRTKAGIEIVRSSKRGRLKEHHGHFNVTISTPPL